MKYPNLEISVSLEHVTGLEEYRFAKNKKCTVVYCEKDSCLIFKRYFWQKHEEGIAMEFDRIRSVKGYTQKDIEKQFPMAKTTAAYYMLGEMGAFVASSLYDTKKVNNKYYVIKYRIGGQDKEVIFKETGDFNTRKFKKTLGERIVEQNRRRHQGR